MLKNRYLKFATINFLITTCGIASGQVNDDLKRLNNRNISYELNAVCVGVAKDFSTQKEGSTKFAVSAFREKGIATVIIDRLGRDAQWIIFENEKSDSSDTEVTVRVSISDHVLNWTRTGRYKNFGDEWIGRVTKGTGAISMNFESRIDGKIIGGTYFSGLCEKR